MGRVLCAGAGGFIGGHMVARLLEDGHEVVAVDVKPFDAWYQTHPSADSYCADLSIADECELAVQGCDVVINLAADMGGMGFITNNKAACMLSVLPSTLLLVAARDAGVERFFYASSACIYPDYRQEIAYDNALRESDAYPAMPEDGYGWEKLFTERMCRHFTEDYGLATRVARFHNVYGVNGTWDGGREKAPAAICRKVAEAVVSGRHEIEIWGDGCLPAGQVVVTPGGLQDIAKIGVGDAVLGSTGFQAVTGAFTRDYKGIGFEITTEGALPFIVTEEHPVLVKRLGTLCRASVRHWCKPGCFCLKHHKPHGVQHALQWLKPGEINVDTDYLCVPRINAEQSVTVDLTPHVRAGHGDGRWQEQATLPSFTVNEDWAWVLGLYLAEGYTSNGKISWCLGAGENDLRRELHERLARCGLRAWDNAQRIHKGKPSSQETLVANSPLAGWLREEFGSSARTKRVPAFVYGISPALARVFVEGWMRGDGDHVAIYSSGRRKGASSSLDLLVGIQLLAARSGNFGTLSWNKNWGGRGIEHGTLSLAERPANVHWFADDRFVYVPVKTVTQIAIEEKVFNLETADHTFGLPVVVHNSQTRSFMYVDDCVEGSMRLLYSDVGEPLNVGSSELVTINELVSLVEDIAGVTLTRRYDRSAPQGVRGRNSDNTLIRERLGWEPSISLREGMEKTYAWVAEQVERKRA